MRVNVVSAEMKRYMASGRCPHCDRPILDVVRTFLGQNMSLSYAHGLSTFDRLRLVPSGAFVTYTPPNTFTCGYCRETWSVHTSEEINFRLHAGSSSLAGAAPAPALVTPGALTPDRFRFTGVTEGARAEVVKRTERKVARNNSSATMTDREEFSWTVERMVTVEERKATINGSDGRLNIGGLAILGKTLTTELRNMYSVTTQSTLTRTKSVSAQIPPHSAIEIKLVWKVVRQAGVGRFSGTGGVRLDIPFEVDMDVTVEWKARNLRSGT